MRTPDEKVSRACARITMHHPFFGAFILRTNVQEATDTKGRAITTMATDGRTIWWNRDFVAKCTDQEVEGVFIHEVLHIVFKHMLRRKERSPLKWNMACDYVIDPIVLDVPNVSIPNWPGLEQHHDRQYDGEFVEAVYEKLPDPPEGQGGCMSIGEVFDMTNENGSPMSAEEMQQAGVEIDQTVMIAAESAKRAGRLPGSIEEYVKSMMEPQVDWAAHLRRFIGGEHPEGFTYDTPDRGPYFYCELMEPSLDKVGVGTIIIGLDVSGSVSTKELQHGLAEMNALTEEFHPRKVIVIQHDSEVKSVEEFEAGEVIDDIKVRGRGGTSVQPVFKWIEESGEQPDRVVMITDMGIWDFGEPTGWPTLWVSTTKESAPWGETTHIHTGAA